MQAGTKTVGGALSEGARRFDAAAIACRAKIDGGNITLWGTKHVVSYPEADFLLVSALLANEDAENGLILLLVPAGTDGISTRTYRLIDGRSEEHTSELQSLMRISYAFFCLKKKNTYNLKTLRII